MARTGPQAPPPEGRGIFRPRRAAGPWLLSVTALGMVAGTIGGLVPAATTGQNHLSVVEGVVAGLLAAGALCPLACAPIVCSQLNRLDSDQLVRDAFLLCGSATRLRLSALGTSLETWAWFTFGCVFTGLAVALGASVRTGAGPLGQGLSQLPAAALWLGWVTIQCAVVASAFALTMGRALSAVASWLALAASVVVFSPLAQQESWVTHLLAWLPMGPLWASLDGALLGKFALHVPAIEIAASSLAWLVLSVAVWLVSSAIGGMPIRAALQASTCWTLRRKRRAAIGQVEASKQGVLSR